MTVLSNREGYERQNLTRKSLQQCIFVCCYFVKTQHATAKCVAVKRQLAPTVLNKEWERESKCLHPMINLAGSCNSTTRNSYCEYMTLKGHILNSESASPDCVSVSAMMVTGSGYATVKMLWRKCLYYEPFCCPTQGTLTPTDMYVAGGQTEKQE